MFVRKLFNFCQNDDRSDIELSEFGFLKDGELFVNVTHLSWNPQDEATKVRAFPEIVIQK